jgi:hypothetical protein
MQEAHEGNDARAAEPPKQLGVMLSGRIESKLGLEPSDHRSSKPRGDDELVPVKRARLRRHTPRVSH